MKIAKPEQQTEPTAHLGSRGRGKPGQSPVLSAQCSVLNRERRDASMNLGGMEAVAQEVAGKAILDHAKETERKLVRDETGRHDNAKTVVFSNDASCERQAKTCRE